MTITTIHPLCDGPISLNAVREERTRKLEAMTFLIRDAECWADERDCRLVLRDAGFSHFEINALMPVAIDAVKEHLVRMEMIFA